MTGTDKIKYRIVFSGTLEEGSNETEVKERLRVLFNTTSERIDRLFTGKPVALNHRLDEAAANDYIAQMHKAGIICSMEPMTNGQPPSPVSSDPSTAAPSVTVPSVTAQNGKTKASSSSRMVSGYSHSGRFVHIIAAGGILLLCSFYIVLIFWLLDTVLSHLDDHFDWLSSLPAFIGPIAYFVPFLFGLLLVGALIKPFFARHPSRSAPLLLSRKKDPAFFSLVAKICRALYAKQPDVIEIDCSTNIRTRYRRGVIGFLEDELTLTVGLGTLSDLTLAEFGSLLAADVGHYVNTFDSRLFYCTSTLGGWLRRSAEDRDTIDTKFAFLRDTAGNIFVKLGCSIMIFFFSAAKLIIKVFLAAARFICRRSNRSFDFAADSRAVSLAGSDIFRSALLKQQISAAASSEASASLRIQRGPNDNALPDNFPFYIRLIALAKDKKSLTRVQNKKKNPEFQRPLPIEERLEHHTPPKQPLFSSDVPVVSLLPSFDELSKETTAAMYRDVLHLQFAPQDLATPEDFMSLQESAPIGRNKDFF